MYYTLRVKLIETEITKQLTYDEVINEIFRMVEGLFAFENPIKEQVINGINERNGVYTYIRQHPSGTFTCTFWEENSDSDKEN